MLQGYESKFNNSNDGPKTAKISAYTYWNNCLTRYLITKHEQQEKVSISQRNI